MKKSSVGLLAVLALALTACDSAPPPLNLAVAKAKAAQCVEPTDDIRRNHMQYLMQHRDETVIDGIRTKQHSLKECISCHVSPTDSQGQALHYPAKEHFCATCHTYAGVKIDCFQCHADRPEVAKQADYQHKIGPMANYQHADTLSVATLPSSADLRLLTETEGAKP